jgi:hypothetical protein
LDNPGAADFFSVIGAGYLNPFGARPGKSALFFMLTQLTPISQSRRPRRNAARHPANTGSDARIGLISGSIIAYFEN